MDLGLRVKLSAMMFLQYAIWGVWLPILPAYLSNYLGFTTYQVGWIVGAAAAIGALLAPFISGQLADRYFSTEKFLAFSALSGGIIMWILSRVEDFNAFLILSILYSVIYFPTISLTNSLSFHHLSDPDKQFSSIRVFGTIGWLVINWIYPFFWLPAGMTEEVKMLAMADCMRWSAVISIAYGIFCFTLPHTPPSKGEQPAPLKALKLLGNPSFLVLFLISFPISVIHTWYFMWASTFLEDVGVQTGNIQYLMSIGQASELIILGLVVGILTKKFGLKKTMMVGILAYAARFFLFANFHSLPMLAFSIAFHGFCFGCFYVSAFIFVDKVCSSDIRASAQTLFSIFILGVGPFAAGPIGGWVAEKAKSINMIHAVEVVRDSQTTTVDYGFQWMVSCGVAIAALILFAVFFRYRDEQDSTPSEA